MGAVGAAGAAQLGAWRARLPQGAGAGLGRWRRPHSQFRFLFLQIRCRPDYFYLLTII